MNSRGVLAVAWLSGLAVVQAEPRIQWVPIGERVAQARVEVTGLEPAAIRAAGALTKEDLGAVLSARVQGGSAPAMLGTLEIEGAVLRFKPQFPLTSGVTYRAEFDPAKLRGLETRKLSADFTMSPPPTGPATELTQIYPSADEVPENLLKFYLHFSAPMSRGHIYEHIHLRDEQGRDVELPFLEIDEELWDPAMKRLTLFIDPGRIKREVKPLEEIGPALQAGHRFSLVVDSAWLDANGRPLAKKHERVFRVTPPDRTPIRLSDWKVVPPAAGTSDALRVDFGESIDHALALRLLRVMGPDRKAKSGAPAVSDAEHKWTFTPSEAWKAGKYEIDVPAILEDLAGNNVGKAFEVELVGRGVPSEFPVHERISFEVQ